MDRFCGEVEAFIGVQEPGILMEELALVQEGRRRGLLLFGILFVLKVIEVEGWFFLPGFYVDEDVEAFFGL